MSSFVRGAHATRAAQSELEQRTPPEHPSEPCFDGDVGCLMNGYDADLVSVHDFRMSAEESLSEMMKDGELIDLVLAACRQQSMLFYTMALKKKIEAHATAMLSKARAEAVEQFQRTGYES